MATVDKWRAQIRQMTDEIPNHRLPEVLDLMEKIIEESKSDPPELEAFIQRIFKEDDELLRKLAEH